MEEISRNIRGYKLGSEYESGGAGCISTVSDYMKFLEAMRTEKIISRETLEIMLTTTLTPEQLNSGNLVAMGYTYGLGVRVPDERKRRTDYGWGGAAGAYLAVDEKNAMTVFYAQHVLNTPNANIRKDVVEAAKLDLGFDAYVADMFRGTGSTLA